MGTNTNVLTAERGASQGCASLWYPLGALSHSPYSRLTGRSEVTGRRSVVFALMLLDCCSEVEGWELKL